MTESESAEMIRCIYKRFYWVDASRTGKEDGSHLTSDLPWQMDRTGTWREMSGWRVSSEKAPLTFELKIVEE